MITDLSVDVIMLIYYLLFVITIDAFVFVGFCSVGVVASCFAV